MINKVTINQLQIEIFKQVASLTNRTAEDVAQDWCTSTQAKSFRDWYEAKELEKYTIIYRIAGDTKIYKQHVTAHEVTKLDENRGYYVDISVIRVI